MSSIDEYGEIKDRYSSFKRMAETIALEDARKDLRQAMNIDFIIQQDERLYFLIVSGYNRFGKFARISYLIARNGRIIRKNINYNEETISIACKDKQEDKQGCIIITACYGEISQEVKISRFFRDNFLAPNFSGRLAIDGYYKISPYIVSKINQFEILKKVVRSIIVNPIVVFEKDKIERNFAIKKVLSSFIYYPCVFFITIAGVLSKTQKLINLLFKK